MSKELNGDSGAVELYRKYRPRDFKDVIGQDTAVSVLQDLLNRKAMPQSLMFYGPSGVGKTTLARILKKELGCSTMDFQEINTAESRGIDTVRDIQSRMTLAPLGGTCKIFLLDECHSLTRRKGGGDAQNALLKTLEDVPPQVYFFLCTTEPDGLNKTIHTRCTKIKLTPLSNKDMVLLLKTMCDKEGVTISKEVLDRVTEVSEGSAREALVCLGSIIGLDNEEAQLDAILSSNVKHDSIAIWKALIGSYSKWPEVAGIIQGLDLEDPERLRRMILACATTSMLGGGKNSHRAYVIVNAFESNWYDSGKAGLVRACWEVVHDKG